MGYTQIISILINKNQIFDNYNVTAVQIRIIYLLVQERFRGLTESESCMM